MKFLRCLSLSLIAILAPIVANAELTKLDVYGQGVVSLAADKAAITLNISARNAKANAAIERVAGLQITMVRTLENAGINSADIISDHVNVGPTFDQQQRRIYAASITVRVINQPPSAIGKILDIGFENGASAIRGISFSAQGADQAALEAYGQAVKNARAKAEEIARAAGLAIVSIEKIAEAGADFGPGPMPMMARDMMVASAMDVSDVNFSARAVEQRATVKITFVLQEAAP